MDVLAKAKELVEGAYYDERNMADVMRQDAAIYAAIAQAEAATRQAAAMEKIAAALYTSDGDLHLLDALYAITEALGRGTYRE